jgi:phage tail-like protein
VDARDPLGAFNFDVTIGDAVVGFAEISGLGCEIRYEDEVVESQTERDSGPHATVTPVHLRRGVTGDRILWSWVESAIEGTDDPRTVTVTLLDATRNPVCSWVLSNARPTQYFGPHLVADAPAPAIEEIVLSAEFIAFRPSL